MPKELTIPGPVLIPQVPVVPYPVPLTPSIFTLLPETCAFDNLPPGVYGLVCHCRRCTPWCTSTSTFL
jgi:hypothetical protein